MSVLCIESLTQSNTDLNETGYSFLFSNGIVSGETIAGLSPSDVEIARMGGVVFSRLKEMSDPTDEIDTDTEKSLADEIAKIIIRNNAHRQGFKLPPNF